VQEIARDRTGNRGLTLIELLISIVVVTLIASVVSGLLATSLEAYRAGVDKLEMQREAAYAMNRMAQYTQTARFLFVPNGRRSLADVLAVSAGIDTDGDGLVDEDSGHDLTDDGKPGVAGIDDDGDGLIDEGHKDDDDEDGSVNEDPIDGIDNDGDGSIDEDPKRDANDDGKAGIKGFDDDDDGEIDEEDNEDDDEDGDEDEDPAEPIIFSLDGDTLMENHPVYGDNELAHGVTAFEVEYELDGANDIKLRIKLELSRGAGSEIELETRVHMENLLQKQGMAVRQRQFGEEVVVLTVNIIGDWGDCEDCWVSQNPGPPYYLNDVVTLTAYGGDEDCEFDEWSGDFPDSPEDDNPLVIVMDADKTVTATFYEND